MKSQDFDHIKFSINELSISANNNYDSSVGKDWELPGVEMFASPFGQAEFLEDNELGVLFLVHFEWEDEQYTPLSSINAFLLSVFRFNKSFSKADILAYPLDRLCQRMYEMVAGIVAIQTATSTYGQYILPTIDVGDFLNKTKIEPDHTEPEPPLMTVQFPN